MDTEPERRRTWHLGEKKAETSVEMAHTSSSFTTLKDLAHQQEKNSHNKRSEISIGSAQATRQEQHRRDSSSDSEDESKRILRKPTRTHSTARADIRYFVAKEYVKNNAFKEFIRHLFFISIMIAAITLHRSAYENYLMNESLITAFVTQQIDATLQPFPKTFLDVGQPDEFRDWLISVVGWTLDSTSFYSGQEKTLDQQEYVMFNNRLIGGVRLRQLRAAPNKGCKMASDLRDITSTCYAHDYSSYSKETKPFGPPEDPTRYTYSTVEETGSVSIFGYELNVIEGDGYVTDVNLYLLIS